MQVLKISIEYIVLSIKSKKKKEKIIQYRVYSIEYRVQEKERKQY